VVCHKEAAFEREVYILEQVVKSAIFRTGFYEGGILQEGIGIDRGSF
jgi:hypothetical protein